MRTKRVLGWGLVAVAVVVGALTVPTFGGTAEVRNGSVESYSSPLGTTLTGSGDFTHTTDWSVSWPAAVACGVLLAVGMTMAWGRREAPPVG